MTERGKFVAFEGGDCSGKSTQAILLYEALKKQGNKVVLTAEPGGTESTLQIRSLLKNPTFNEDSKVALCLFLADRTLHITEVIKPSLDRGEIIICDRYEASTIAYQGFAGGLPVDEVKRFNDFMTGGLKPDLTILIDVSPQAARERAINYRFVQTIYDQESLDFYEKVREGFLYQASLSENKLTWEVIDGHQSIEGIHQKVLDTLKSHGIV